MWELWEDLLSPQDRAVIQEADYAVRGSAFWESRRMGQRPALLVIDMQEMLVGPDLPILEAIRHYRTAMGEVAWRALAHIAPFIAAVRGLGFPIIYTRVITRGCDPSDPAVQIIPDLAPDTGELVIDKPHTSAFYGTDLVTQLVRRGVDTLLVVGNSTSGCVRAAVVDARQLGFQVLVPVECVFDRVDASHRIGLLDMWMKYAAVVPVADALEYLREVAG